MLQMLFLNSNNLTYLELGTFRYLVRCRTIFLQCNKISQISDGGLDGLKHLKYLDLRNNSLVRFHHKIIDDNLKKQNTSTMYITYEWEKNMYGNFCLCQMDNKSNTGVYIIRKTRNKNLDPDVELLTQKSYYRSKYKRSLTGICDAELGDCCNLQFSSWRAKLLKHCYMQNYSYLGSFKGYNFSCQRNDINFSIPNVHLSILNLITKNATITEATNQTIVMNTTSKYNPLTQGLKIKSTKKNNKDSSEPKKDEYVMVMTFVGPSVAVVLMIAGFVMWKMMRQNVKKQECGREGRGRPDVGGTREVQANQSNQNAERREVQAISSRGKTLPGAINEGKPPK